MRAATAGRTAIELARLLPARGCAKHHARRASGPGLSGLWRGDRAPGAGDDDALPGVRRWLWPAQPAVAPHAVCPSCGGPLPAGMLVTLNHLATGLQTSPV
jgi:hypothetical protein